MAPFSAAIANSQNDGDDEKYEAQNSERYGQYLANRKEL